jgi:hypothetical protein
MRLWSVISPVLLSLYPCHCTLVSSGSGEALPIYNHLSYVLDRWNVTGAVVNLLLDRSIFDYCDVDRYSKDSVLPLLAAHEIQLNDTDLHDGWIAYLPTNNITIATICPKTADWYPSLALTWPQVLASRLQDLGAVGYIMQSDTLSLTENVIIDRTEVVGDAYFVDGKEITIFGAYIRSLELQSMLSAALHSKKPVIVQVFPDENPLRAAVASRGSVYGVLSVMLTWCSFACFLDSLRLLRKSLQKAAMTGNIVYTQSSLKYA